MRHFLFAFLLVAACNSEGTPEPPVRDARQGIPEWVAPEFVIGQRSATIPEFAEPEIIFKLHQGDCSSLVDQTGPSDCATRTSRSVLTAGKEWRLGHQNLFGFEFWIDPELTYQGYRNADAELTNEFSSRLSIARWQGSRFPQNQLFDLKVDATRGVTFLGRTCVPPSEFGSWHRFWMRIRWSNDGTGFLEVRCDGSLHTGLPIYAASNISTNQALHCFRENNCEPDVYKDPQRFNMQLGIMFDPATVNGQRVFSRIQPGGLTVKMRRLVVRRLYVIFGRVETF